MADTRSMKERYFYFVRGRQLVVLENKTAKDYGNVNNPTYQPPTGGTDTLDGVNDGEVGFTEGLLIEYTAIPDLAEVLSESDNIPIADALNTAMVDYVKGRLVEDVQDFRKKEYYMVKFKERVAKYARMKTGGSRVVQGTGFMR